MHPTPDEQLDVIAALIDHDPDGAARLVRRLRRSWAQRLPFLVEDNALAAALLVDLAPRLPSLEAEIAAKAAHLPTNSEPAAHDANVALQSLLARAINELPDDAAGDAGRSAIAAYLRARLVANPALHRNPAPRTVGQI